MKNKKMMIKCLFIFITGILILIFSYSFLNKSTIVEKQITNQELQQMIKKQENIIKR